MAAGLIRSAADQAVDHADRLARSQADVLWERAYDELQGRFERLADRLQPDFNLGHGGGGSHGEDPGLPVLWWASFMTSSGRPVTATRQASVAEAIRAAFEDSAPAGPDVGLRVEFEHSGRTFRYSSGVSRGGHTIAEGPSGVIDAPHGVIGCYGEIKAVLRGIGNFIDCSEPSSVIRSASSPEIRLATEPPHRAGALDMAYQSTPITASNRNDHSVPTIKGTSRNYFVARRRR